MKLIEDGIKKFGTIGQLHLAIVRAGVDITSGALEMSQRRASKSIRLDVLNAMAEVVYDGDWARLKKAIQSDLKSE